MSRMLSELLGTNDPQFRLNLQQLEQAAGGPSADIRLGVQITNDTRAKIQELGLDPHDTTGPELYAALLERFKADEKRVRTGLGFEDGNSVFDLQTRLKTFLEKLDLPTESFVIKQAVMRQLLKKMSPKTTMKRLGYRSMDSMLKHEAPAQLFAAAWVCESKEWHKELLKAYEKLQPSDFETRRVTFYFPVTKHWPTIAAQFIEKNKHNILCIRELGAVIMLPLEKDLPGLAITSLLLGFEYINAIRSQSSFLKLQQVRIDFGEVLKQATLYEPITNIEIGGQPLPWKIIQRFYGRSHANYHPEVFEPHVQPEDLTWHDAEQALTPLDTALEFWVGGQMLALLDHEEPVSLNLLDVSLSACNGLDYSERIVHYMRDNVWHALMSKYLNQENLETMVLSKLNHELAPQEEFDDQPELSA